MGSRMLGRWLNSPLKDSNIIKSRHESVKKLQPVYKKLQSVLLQINDVERIYARLSLRTAVPYDFIRMRSTLETLPDLQLILKKIQSKNIQRIGISIGSFKDIIILLKKAINLTPSKSIKDGNVIAPLYNIKLDNLRAIRNNFKKYIQIFEEQEKKN